LLDGKPLFEFKHGEVKLYHDDHKPGPEYSFDWAVSALATIVSRPDNKKLTWFRNWVEMMFIVSLQPKAMPSETASESNWLNRDGTNFASWYRYISQDLQLCRSTGLTPNAPQALATACDEYVLTTNKSVMPKSVN
jgi:hypothetical protein